MFLETLFLELPFCCILLCHALVTRNIWPLVYWVVSSSCFFIALNLPYWASQLHWHCCSEMVVVCGYWHSLLSQWEYHSNKVLLYHTYIYAKYQWHTRCHKFRWRSHDVPVPNTTAVYKYIRRLLMMGPILNSKRTSERHVLS